MSEPLRYAGTNGNGGQFPAEVRLKEEGDIVAVSPQAGEQVAQRSLTGDDQQDKAGLAPVPG